MIDTKLVGDISVEMVKVELLKNGFMVLCPVGDRFAYDLAIDLQGALKRIQVKTAHKSTAANPSWKVKFRKVYMRSDGPVIKFYEDGTIDYFVAVVQELNEFYVIPFPDLDGQTTLTLTPSGNRANLHQAKFNPELFKQRWDLMCGK